MWKRFGISLLAVILLLVCWIPLNPSRGQSSQAKQQALRFNNLGVAYMEQLKFEDAANQFSQALQLDAQFLPGHVNLGIAAYYRLDYETALRSLQRALELDPQEIRAQYVLGLIYQNQDEVEKAIESLSNVHRKDPDDPSTNYYLGTLYNRQREFDTAIQYLQKAIQKQPYNASAHYNLSRAYFRSGDREKAQQELAEFERLGRLFGSTTVGHQYLEQGRYALVIDRVAGYLPEDRPALPPSPVSFENVAGAAGLRFQHGGPKTLEADGRADAASPKLAAFVGSGVSFGDYDGDGLPDLLLANAATQGAASRLFRNLGKGRFEDVTARVGIQYSGRTMAALWGDADSDGDLDLYLVNDGPNVLYRNDNGQFADVTNTAGVGDSSWGLGGAFVDYDHDGDLDILIANLAGSPTSRSGAFPEGLEGATNLLYQNDGQGSFTNLSAKSGLAGGKFRTTSIVATDFDNSRDIDFYAVNQRGPNQLFSNLRDGSFRDLAASVGADLTGGLSAVTGDANRDGFMDLLVVGERAELLLNQNGQGFQRTTLPAGSAGPFQGGVFLDYDNDGDQDLLLLGSSPFAAEASGRALTLLENRGGRFQDVTEQAGLSAVSSLPVRGVSVADYDQDGDLDLACNVNGGAPLLLRNNGGNRNPWIQVRLQGTNSNRPGIGAKVEILAGDHWEKAEVSGGHGMLSQSPPVVHFGLGSKNSVDVVRLLWPGGVLQSEIDPAVNRRIDLQELDRKGTSCPILYVWNGETFQFQTDFLGGSAFGSLLAPGVYNYPDTDEYVKLDRSLLRLRDGKVAVTLNNQLEEVIFFDQLELVAVDHAADYEIFPDEKLLPGPPYLDFRIITASRPRPVLAAADGQGHDLSASLHQVDRVYADLVQPLPYKGYAQTSELVLDLGEVDPSRTFLLMHAWIDYADSTSNLAASQAGLQLTPPYLQVEDEQGRWVTVIERMGFPAGLPKHMTVDLSGKFLSDSRRVKIVTNMRIHWDQILVESGPAREGYRVHRLKADRADLHFRGYPAWVSPDGRLPRIYDYRRISPEAGWKVHIGAYTRFGDVLPLLDAADDRYVISRSGDEIEATFPVGQLPPLREGWVRDYLVFVDGFGKDMDIHSAAPDFVGPLPYHGMPAYPYPPELGYPLDETRREYLEKWNTRWETSWFGRLRVPEVE